MEIASLHLQTFRSYNELELNVFPGVNILYGLNGQGKTNLLEALYLCTAARSHRTSRDVDLISYDADHYRVQVTFSPNGETDYQERLELSYRSARGGLASRRAERVIKHDGIVLERIADLMGIFHAVMFAPEDLSLIKDGPGERRRFMDILMSQLRPLYFMNLQRLQTILNQRNALLKHMQTAYLQSSPRDQIRIWNAQLAQVSAEIIKMRDNYCQRISHIANAFHETISDEKETLSIRYRTRSSLDPSGTVEDLQTQIMAELEATLDEDIRRGFTTIGPHRDDLLFRLDGKDLRLYGSQGQQRTAVLALKLAELRIIEEDTGEKPVLLLDDVMSELDRYRRHALVAAITDCQIFITCTEPEHVIHDWETAKSLRISLFHVDQGTVTHMPQKGLNEGSVV